MDFGEKFRAGSLTLFIIHLEHGQKRFAGHGNGTELAHALLAFLLLFQQLFLSGDVAAVALGQHVLAHASRFHGR